MDIKTLEYMSERVDEGKDILQQIEDCKKLIDEIETSNNMIAMVKLVYTSCWKKEFIMEDKRLVKTLENKMIEVAEERIKKLEEKFAKL